MQEEACILKIPCVTVRKNTERPETIEAGINILAGTEPKKILECAKAMAEGVKDWQNPFGDGHAAEKILDTTKEVLKKSRQRVDSYKIKTVKILKKIGLK